MQIDARVEAWASLQHVPGLSSRSLVALLKAFGGPAEVLGASRASLSKFVAPELAAALARGGDRAEVERTLSWAGKPGHALLAWDDPAYPPALLTIVDPPPTLYCIGDSGYFSRPAVAIVGSRNATPQGRENAHAFAAALSAAGLTIVSGLAQGIDAAAHRGGLEGSGSSIAVMGTGIDRVYPAANKDLARELAERGALLSQFALGAAPLPGNFPRRNRVLSGLARGVLVVEATPASGSLITARFAVEQGREVFAIPGSIHSPFSKGSHRLIKDGAKLVETAQDVLEELGIAPSGDAAGEKDKLALAGTASGAAARLLAALGHDPAGVDLLVERTGLAAHEIAVLLVELELAGQVRELPGGTFERVM
ncbi:MAG TPA: DNA-processing protein DprA [Casimicrobiaceae bacterium]|nr:DNA-processing protein DprA [Casimicrobiaceae bacterium]